MRKMLTAADNDATDRDLVAEGRTEALRLRRQVIESMHPQLKPLANRVLEVGLEVKRAAASVRRLRRREEERRRGRREEAAAKLQDFADGFAGRFVGDGGSWANYDAGSIEAAFEEYRRIARNFSDVGVEEKIMLSEEGKCLQETMETRYVGAVIALDDKSEQLGELRPPWDLRYFATAELDAETGKTVVTMPFDAGGAGDDLDMCASCDVIFKAGEVRVRCFECRNVTTCGVCYDVATKLRDTLQKSEPPPPKSGNDGLGADNNNNNLAQQRRMGWEAARKELETCCPHLQHLSAEEDDLLCELRHKALAWPKNTPKEQKMTLRRLLPRFFTIAYANRPCFGVPLYGADAEEPSAADALTLKRIPYRWFTYKTVWRTIALLAVELVRILPPPPPSDTEREDSPPEGSSATESASGPEIGIFSSPGPAFFACELACVAAGRVPVAADAAWRTGDALSALAASGATTLLLDPAGFRAMKAEGAAPPPAVRNVVVLATDPFDESTRDSNVLPRERSTMWSSGGVRVDFVFSEREEWHDADQGDAAIAKLETHAASHAALPGDKYVLGIFSSGTSESGGRKGVLIREEVFRKEQTKCYLGHPLVAPLMYSPTWGTGKEIVWTSLCSGGRVGFAMPRLHGLRVWDYLYSIQPTWCVSLVPALMSLLLEDHAAVLAREKLEAVGAGFDSSDVRKMEALAQARAAEHLYSCLGGAAEVVSIGGAMVNQAHVERLSRILPCRVVQNYGSTEGGGLGEGKHGRADMKPVRDLKFKIEDRPEIGYTAMDRPHPRGELLIQSDVSSRAEDWFGTKEAVSTQKQKYTPDGFYRTGDIVELLPDTNTFRIIDRVGSLVKLPCGIFFSPFQVEAAVGSLSEYGVTDHIVAVTPQGNVALILEKAVPAMKLPSDNALHILAEAQRRCRRAGIDQRLIPSHLVADSGAEAPSTADSADNRLWKAEGCYTASGKLIRHRVLDRYNVATQMSSIDSGGEEALPHTRVSGAEDNAETIAAALLESVGLCGACGGDDEIAAMLSMPLAAAGIDSLLWAKLSSVMRQTLAQRWQLILTVPYFDLNKRSAVDLASWMLGVQKQIGSQTTEIVAQQETIEKAGVLPSTADDINCLGNLKEPSTSCKESKVTVINEEVGNDSDDIKGEFKKYLSDLDLLENELFKQAASIDRIDCGQVSRGKTPASSDLTVLLTGATGFLGRHILAALIDGTTESLDGKASDQNVVKRNVKVICLVRGPSHEEASRRLVEGFPPNLRHLFPPEVLSTIRKEDKKEACSDGPQIQVVLGDVAQKQLGLPTDAYQKLASDVDVIIHAAAVVKMPGRNSEHGEAHDMIYSNTMSCVHIAQLAAHTVAVQRIRRGHQHPIPVVYISTKSVERDGLPPGTIVERCSEAYTTLDLRHDPYSLSKLLGETVLIRGSRANKYSLIILRPGFLTFSSEGDANDNDWLVRLLLTISELGISPRGGQSVFLRRHTAYKPVDEYASQVVHAAISSIATSSTGSEITWPTLSEDEESFCVQDVIDNLGSVHRVSPYAFAAAVKLAKYPSPFFPLVDWLYDGDSYERQERSTQLSSTFAFSTDGGLDQEMVAVGQGGTPQSLLKGLCAFIEKRCPGLSILE